MNTKDILNERETTHGEWRQQAHITHRLKEALRDSIRWDILTCSQREALDMICVKMGRILTGDPSEPDHWLDIAGYSTLEHKELTEGKAAI